MAVGQRSPMESSLYGNNKNSGKMVTTVGNVLRGVQDERLHTERHGGSFPRHVGLK